jgi:hypothetical protein
MIVSVHFRADADAYSFVSVFSIQDRIFRQLTGTDAYLHTVIAARRSSPLTRPRRRRQSSLLQALIEYDPRKWRTIHSDEFTDILCRSLRRACSLSGHVLQATGDRS